VKGHGLSDKDVKRQYAIATEFFNLPLEEKTKYLANTAAGDFRGYKAKATGDLASKDNDERYNIPKFTPEHERPHPQLILDHYEEIKEFSLVSTVTVYTYYVVTKNTAHPQQDPPPPPPCLRHRPRNRRRILRIPSSLRSRGP